MRTKSALPVLLILFWGALLLPGQVVPGLFILDLDGPGTPARARAASAGEGVRAAVEQAGGEIVSTLDAVMQGLVVRTGDDQEAALAALPGVAKVYRVHQVRLETDRAPALHRAPQAWLALGGFQNAGLGERIAVIDSGIDVDHPAFRQDGLAVPEGFPRGNRETDLAGTSHKIIVARSYENLIEPSSTPTTRDVLGHGTALAMVAAGRPHSAPYGNVSGIAPMAFLGSYKVFGATGTTRSDVIIRAIDDAVRDGMGVINLSLGVFPAPRPSEDALVLAVERAIEAGVIVVTSAGNSGPDPVTISSPGNGPNIIAVGANVNDRIFAATVTVGAAPPYLGRLSDAPPPAGPIQAPMRDVAGLDGDGRACAALPSESLAGRIALVARGTCLFEQKLNNAQTAGAVGAVVYTDDRPVVSMAVGSARLPSMMVSREDGLSIRAQLGAEENIEARMVFRGAAYPVDPNQVAGFSSRGPSEERRIRPDLLAVGQEVYTAAQSTDPGGEIYSPDGYATVNGTSFASPMVAGAAAVLRAARPGMHTSQYRSLLVNTATPLMFGQGRQASAQSAGAGLLNLEAALASTVAAYPAMVSFGAGDSTNDVFRTVNITNVGTATDTYTVVAEAFAGGPAPAISPGSFTVDPWDSRLVGLRLAVTGLPAGTYEGVLRVTGSREGSTLRVPYWYAVATAQPGFVTVVDAPESAARNGLVSVLFRVTDPSGIILTDLSLQVTSDTGSLVSLQSLDSTYPGVWRARLRMGPQAGMQAFRIRAGERFADVLIPVN